MPAQHWNPERWRQIEGGSYVRITTPPEEGEDALAATPGAVERAAELGVDLTMITGTGKGGRITKGDVEAAVA